MKSWTKSASASLLLLLALSVNATLCRADNMLDVPAYLQEAGCSPTAAAMVLGFWDQSGYPNLFAGTTAEIDRLATLMGTTDGLTEVFAVAPAISSFATQQGYSFLAWNIGWDSDKWDSAWDDVTHMLDLGLPFVAHVDSSGDGVLNHSVTVIGYHQQDGTNPNRYCFYTTWGTDYRCEPFVPIQSGQAWGASWFTYVMPNSPRQQQVPEPSSMALLAVGGFAVWRKLRNPSIAR